MSLDAMGPAGMPASNLSAAVPGSTGVGVDTRALLAALPALGPVLCQYPEHPAGSSRPQTCRCRALDLSDTVVMRVRLWLDADGPQECVELCGADGALRMRAWLLPDSDFCAWEVLLSRVPRAVPLPACTDCGPWHSYRLRRAGVIGGSAHAGSFRLRDRRGWRDLSITGVAGLSMPGRTRAAALIAQWRMQPVPVF